MESAEQWLAGEEDRGEYRVGEAFERFGQRQPELAQRVGRALARSGDELAAALGYFVGAALWLAFDDAFGDRLDRVTDTAAAGVEEALSLDEQLRGADPHEALETDDVVAMEQPHAVGFVRAHLENALGLHSDADVDALHAVYRLLLLELLALSYAVREPAGLGGSSSELCA